MKLNLNSGDSITAVMSGAAATTNPKAIMSTRGGSSPGGTSAVALSGTTPVTLVAAPTLQGMSVDSILVYNADTAAVTLTLTAVLGGVSIVLCKPTLQAGDVLLYDDAGLQVLDSSGQLKTSGTQTAVLPFALNFMDARVHDAVATNLPATAAADDLGLINGTDGTAFPSIRTLDYKATTTTAYARLYAALPANYVPGAAVTLRLRCGMLTTVSDGTALVDAEVFSNDGDATGSADICATTQQSINSLTFANYDFTITPTGLVAGQMLNIRLKLTGTDAATATAVLAAIAHVELRATCYQ